MVPIARRNLFHDKLKLTTALVGVVFAVLLTTSLAGLFIGNMYNTSGIIDHAGADLWIVARGSRSFDLCEPMSERRLYQALATPGVLWAEKLLVQFAPWRLPDGRQENSVIIGLEANSRLNLPWAMAAGSRDAILHDRGVILDERERERFGRADRPLQIDDHVEVFGLRARIAGFSRDVGSFTISPYVFTTHKLAQQCTIVPPGQTKFVVVKAAPDTPILELKARLARSIADVDVLTAGEFARLTRQYWLFGTGVGMGIIFAAVLGLLVGLVVVGQTIYSATLDRLGEYGTLKAMGFTNAGLAGLIVRQGLLVGAIGFGIGGVLTGLIAPKLPDLNLAVVVPWWAYAAMLVITLLMCAGASLTSVVKVFRLPPAMVFRR